jgi:hypothetical protein
VQAAVLAAVEWGGLALEHHLTLFSRSAVGRQREPLCRRVWHRSDKCGKGGWIVSGLGDDHSGAHSSRFLEIPRWIAVLNPVGDVEAAISVEPAKPGRLSRNPRRLRDSTIALNVDREAPLGSAEESTGA